MDTAYDTTEEVRLAQEIVSVLPVDVAAACCGDRSSVRFTVRANGFRLRAVVFDVEALRRLVNDPLRKVKVEYLQRDLLLSTRRRVEFRYPRRPHVSAGDDCYEPMLSA